MTRAEVIEMVRQRLGFNTRMDETKILNNLDYVQNLYELGHDNMPLAWFLFDATATISTVASQKHVALPDGFIQFDDDWPLYIETAEGVKEELTREPGYKLSALRNEGEGFPKHFEIDGAQLLLYPTPDDTYTITIPHYAHGTALSQDADSPWFDHFPALLIEETCNSIMRSVRDLEGLKMSTVNHLRSDYLRRVEARKHELKSYQSA